MKKLSLLITASVILLCAMPASAGRHHGYYGGGQYYGGYSYNRGYHRGYRSYGYNRRHYRHRNYDYLAAGLALGALAYVISDHDEPVRREVISRRPVVQPQPRVVGHTPPAQKPAVYLSKRGQSCWLVETAQDGSISESEVEPNEC